MASLSIAKAGNLKQKRACVGANKGSLAVRKVQFFWTLFKRGRGGQTHVQKLCCKFGVFWRSFNNMKFTTWNSPHDVQTKGGGGKGGAKAFWKLFKKTALFLHNGFPYVSKNINISTAKTILTANVIPLPSFSGFSLIIVVCFINLSVITIINSVIMITTKINN